MLNQIMAALGTPAVSHSPGDLLLASRKTAARRRPFFITEVAFTPRWLPGDGGGLPRQQRGVLQKRSQRGGETFRRLFPHQMTVHAFFH